MGLLLLIVLVVLLVGTLPSWPYSRGWGWGYRPTSVLVALLVLLLILALLGQIVLFPAHPVVVPAPLP